MFPAILPRNIIEFHVSSLFSIKRYERYEYSMQPADYFLAIIYRAHRFKVNIYKSVLKYPAALLLG
jgi:hypothetical protein